jgi:hypothetical protein
LHMMYVKYTGKIVHIIYSFCVANFMLLAGRLNFGIVAKPHIRLGKPGLE